MSETERALESVFAQIVRQMLFAFLIIGALGLGIGYLVSDIPGLYGALMGLGVTAFFMGTTAIIGLLTAKASIQVAQAAFVGAWVLKIVVVLVLIWLVKDRDFYDAKVFFVVVAVSIMAATAIEMRAVMQSRVPTIDTSQRMQ